MFALTRKLNESIMINDDIRITILKVEKGKISIGIEAPQNVKIVRKREVMQVKGLKKPVKKEEVKPDV